MSNSYYDCDNCGRPNLSSDKVLWTKDNRHPCCSDKCRNEYGAKRLELELLAFKETQPPAPRRFKVFRILSGLFS